jgi:Fe-S-cluster containining protein
MNPNPPVTAHALPDFSEALNPDPVEELDLQLRKASFFTQASLEQTGQLAQRLDTYLTALLDLLIEEGVVDTARLGELVDRNREVQAQERAEQISASDGLGAWPLVVLRSETPDDAAEPETPVDCAARMHICKAICCSLRFPLGASEVESGKVKFDIGQPYMIRHTQHGYCVHNDRATGRCQVYDDRPQVCRADSCANDKRIWTDFENMTLNTEYLNSRKPQGFFFKPAAESAVSVNLRRADATQAAS